LPDIAVTVQGADRLASTLRKAGADVSDMKAANQRVGEVVAVRARQLAPRDTGWLRDSIKAGKRVRGAQVRAGGRRYVWVQNYGSAKRHIRPKMFMQNALEQKQDEAIDLYFEEMERIMSKVQGA
jgi:HK97 gp10 family phage protein